MATCVQPRDDWTVVLRRQLARILDGLPHGGYTDLYEIICCDCGDHPDLDYREVSPRLRLVRGPARSRLVLPPTSGTSGCISSRDAPAA